MDSRIDPLLVRVMVLDPPFDEAHGVLIGIQRKRDVEAARSASGTATFDIRIDLKRTGSDVDFAGPYVHGANGDRFVYVSWGRPDGAEPFVMFARSKIKLADLPSDLIDEALASGGALVCEINGTNPRGQLATGSVRPPEVSWHIAP